MSLRALAALAKRAFVRRSGDTMTGDLRAPNMYPIGGPSGFVGYVGADRWLNGYFSNLYPSSVVELGASAQLRWNARMRLLSPTVNVLQMLDWAGSNAVYQCMVSGSPEGSTAAPPGSVAFDYTNGRLYLKRGSGTNSTGWVLVSPGEYKQISNDDSPYTLPDWVGYLRCEDPADSFVVNLPPAASYPGRRLVVKDATTGGATTVTLAPTAGTIEGGTSTILSGGELAEFIADADGTDWVRLATLTT